MNLKYLISIVIFTSIISVIILFFGSMFLPMYVRDSVDGSTSIKKKITESYYYYSSNGIVEGDEQGGITIFDKEVDSIGFDNKNIIVYSKNENKYTTIRLSNSKIDSITINVRFKDYNSIKLVDLSSFLENTK